MLNTRTVQHESDDWSLIITKTSQLSFYDSKLWTPTIKIPMSPHGSSAYVFIITLISFLEKVSYFLLGIFVIRGGCLYLIINLLIILDFHLDIHVDEHFSAVAFVVWLLQAKANASIHLAINVVFGCGRKRTQVLRKLQHWAHGRLLGSNMTVLKRDRGVQLKVYCTG